MKHSRTHPEYVSKSQRKRDAQALLKLGMQLVNLTRTKLESMPLDDDIREAVDFTRSIRSNVARKRQLHYLAKLLRRIDPEPVVEALQAAQSDSRQLVNRQHRVEAWRDALLDGGDSSLGELCRLRPDTDAQTLRQLIRNAHREVSHNKPPSAARSLFRKLRDMDQHEALPPTA
jgi:ribosome-associated protein